MRFVPALSFSLAVILSSVPARAQEENPPNPAVIPVPKEGRWMDRHEAMNARVKQGNVDLLFIGDSITQGWERAGSAVWERHYARRNAVNLGISGDRTEHVLWRLANGNLDGISPKAAVIMIGTNNSGRNRNSASQIVEGITAIVHELRTRLPETKLLLLDIFPRGEQFNDQRGKILQVNQTVRRLDDAEHVHYLAIGHRFLQADGSISPEIMPDFLHLTEAGYEIWADAIEAKLVELLGERGRFFATFRRF